MNPELELVLSELIASGDCIETSAGNTYKAIATVSIRIGTRFRQAIVPVEAKTCLMPIHLEAIRAIWRNGVCIWRLGENPVQRRLFE